MLRVRGNNKPAGGTFPRFSASTFNVILRRYSLLEVPRRRIHNAVAHAMSICVALGNKVMDTRLPQPVGCSDKYDVPCWGSGLLRRCTPRNDVKKDDIDGKRDRILTKITFKGLDVVRQYALKLFETAESDVDKVVSSCEKNPSVRWRYMNFLRQRKTALDAPLYAVSAGRSMIEMLGVLAIIAVLSVVGLDGFSKAMRMYRSAVQKETLEHLLANMVKIRNNLNHEVKTFENISYLFAAMGELPNGITFRDNRLYDKSGNSFTVYFGKNTWKTPTGTASSFEYHVRINWEQKDNSTSPTAYDSCINTLEVAKANSNEIKTVTQFIGNSEAFLSYDQSNISWKNMTVTQMNEVCKSCTAEKACSLILYINP